MADYTIPFTTGMIPEEGSTWGLVSNNITMQSPLNGAVQVVEQPGAAWTCGIRIDRTNVSQTAELEAFLVKLRGQANRALIPPFHRMTPRGSIAGSPKVNTSVQTGTTLVMYAVTAGTTLLPGDFLGVNQGATTAQIVMVTAATSATAGGVMSCTIFPEIRTAPSSGSTVVTSGPTARFILASPTFRFNPRIAGQGDFNIDFVEAVAL